MPCTAIFPQEEPSFNVDELISALESKDVEVHKFVGDTDSATLTIQNIMQESAQTAVSKMMKFLW